MTRTHRRRFQTSALNAAILAVSGALRAQDLSATNPPVSPGQAVTNVLSADTNFFTGEFVDAFKHGKFNLNARLRYENADQAGLEAAHAITLRTRFGFTTAPLYGFQGMLEGQNDSLLGPEDAYNAAGSNKQTGKTVIADAPVTALSQAWLSYSNWNSTLKGGQQHLNLDNQRFIGDSAWRQIWQTYDAVTFANQSLDDFTFFYGYVWHVRRVYGNVPNLPAANQDFTSDSHLFNISYDGFKYGKFTAYSYLLDFANAPKNSSATFGGSFAGGVTLDPDANAKVNYRAEYARQTDYRNQPISYNADYYNLELGGEYDRFNAGAGYEVLGSDGGKKGFATPLATLHAFSGWAEVFLNTPNAGLRDAYGWVGAKLPGGIPLRVIGRNFDADSGSANFGEELDAVASRKLGKNWTVMVEYANYWAHDATPPGQTKAADVQKFWASVEFDF